MKQFVIIKLDIEGLHAWKECELYEVHYLRYLHRHKFYIEVYFSITKDRGIEFIKMKHLILDHFKKYYSDDFKCYLFKNMSCESIAKEIIEIFNASRCYVYEDNENGSLVINE